MVILGLLLVAAGVVAIVAAVATASGTVELLGTDLDALTIFCVGVGAAVAILWGFSITKFGTKRSLQHRRESKKLDRDERHGDEPGPERGDRGAV